MNTTTQIPAAGMFGQGVNNYSIDAPPSSLWKVPVLVRCEPAWSINSAVNPEPRGFALEGARFALNRSCG